MKKNKNINTKGLRVSNSQPSKESKEAQKARAEYRRRLGAGEFVKPDVLLDKKIFDVLMMEYFILEIQHCIDEQVGTREAVLKMIAELKSKGKRISENKPVVDRVIEAGLMDDTGEFIVEFAKVLNKESTQPSAVREYIRQLGMVAYNRTIEAFIREADPEMKELFEKFKTQGAS